MWSGGLVDVEVDRRIPRGNGTGRKSRIFAKTLEKPA
jgi:hypothetical protein